MRKFVIITIVFKILISNIRLYIEYIKEEVRYMDMKKLSKVISIVLIVMMLVAIGTNVFAAVTGATNPSTLTGQAVSGTDRITKIGNQIITILTIVGTVASVIVLIVLGLKYMMGSAEEKAEYKKTMMPYVIGAALVFAASAIAGMIYSFAINLG